MPDQMLTQYVVRLKRDPIDRRFVTAELVKTWFVVSERSTERRVMAQTVLDASGMTEREVIAYSLTELGAAWRDEIS